MVCMLLPISHVATCFSSNETFRCSMNACTLWRSRTASYGSRRNSLNNHTMHRRARCVHIGRAFLALAVA